MTNLTIEAAYLSDDDDRWDSYVYQHPKSKCYHLSAWLRAIRKSYGHQVYRLVALQSDESPDYVGSPAYKQLRDSSDESPIPIDCPAYDLVRDSEGVPGTTKEIAGILPLVHMKHFLFGNALISTAFSDYGGILANNESAERLLLNEAIKLGRKLKVDYIELRQIEPLPWFLAMDDQKTRLYTGYGMPDQDSTPLTCATRSHKVSVFLDLPESPEALMNSFRSKLRSQIKRPLKEGLDTRIGSLELLDDFYKVFTINMKHLGSPVHSKKLMRNILLEFREKARITAVYKDQVPLAASMVLGFKDTLLNPWASSLREHSRLSPNMLLYWSMMDFACANGFKYFDFGRSSPDEGTYKFKTQWGSKTINLNWHHISLDGQHSRNGKNEKEKFSNFIELWKKLPLQVTTVLGPFIRKHIGL